MTTNKPKALAVSYTFNDVANNALITATGAKEAYGLLEAKRFALLDRMFINGGDLIDDRTGKRSGSLGGFGMCYGTVNHCVKLFGGNAVYGWSVAVGSCVAECLPTANNAYAAYGLTGHVVWQTPDGRLCEVTEIVEGYGSLGCEVLGFLPHNRVKCHCQAGINFVDRYDDARHVFIEGGGQVRTVRL